MDNNIWHALVHVIPINGNTDLGNAKGAFVNVAYKAFNEADFISTVTESFLSFDFNVMDFESIETEFNLSIINFESAEKLKLNQQIKDGNEFAWGVFYSYSNE